MNNETSKPQEGAFIKAMIKFTNPTWTAEQIESEYQRKLIEVVDDPEGCDMCSG